MEKKLYKSETNKMLAGVCGGIAEDFNIDPTLASGLGGAGLHGRQRPAGLHHHGHHHAQPSHRGMIVLPEGRPRPCMS